MKSQSNFLRLDWRSQFVYVAILVLAVLMLAWWTLRPPLLPERLGSPQGRMCGLEFELPADWSPRTTQPEGPIECALTLVQASQDSSRSSAPPALNAVSVWVYRASFDSAARAYGFERRGDKWVVLGRQGMEAEAAEFAGNGWRGVRGTAVVGCSSPIDSTSAGLCDAPRAVVADSAWAVVVEAGPKGEEVFDLLLKTLRIRPH